MRSDGLLKSLSNNKEAVFYVIDATEMVQESMERIGSFPPATVHLGQSMMAAALLQALSDGEDEKVSLQWNVKGPFGPLYAEARNFGEIRGTIQNPQAPIFDFATSLGTGTLQVRKLRKAATTSLVNCQGNVVLDMLSYLEQSEQRYCGMNLSVKIGWLDEQQKAFKVEHALGYLIDILPQPSPQEFDSALYRWNQHMLGLGDISQWALGENKMQNMLQFLSGEAKPQITLQQRILFKCHCTEERAARALSLANKQEAVVPDGKTELRCEYCGKIYFL